MTPGLVSVIVASYNHERFLQRRMDSLIAQTYQPLEILVIDDCSPDHSVDVLRRYEAHLKVRLIIRETNGGWAAVSNQGVDLTSGEFVLFANCDDDCDPRMIERLVAVSDKEYISEEDLPLEFHFAQLEPKGTSTESLFEDATNTFERNFILRALEKCGWNVTGAAEYLGIPLSTLKYKMDKLDVRQIAKRLRGA